MEPRLLWLPVKVLYAKRLKIMAEAVADTAVFQPQRNIQGVSIRCNR